MNLRIPGPIPVPDDILDAMSGPMINHRGPEFKEILYRVTEGLKKIFETKNDVYILTSSGTGAMEAAIVNTLSPGDKVLNATVGIFGNRFGEIAGRYGAEVINLTFPFGHAVELDQIRETLKKHRDVKAVMITHNETSTGVTNDLKSITKLVKDEFDKLVLVDGISSVCSIPLSTDDWGCDVIATASQKGWMLPPGLAFVSFSDSAWEAYKTARMPKFYFDLEMYKRYYEIGQPPYTPSISTILALDIALNRLMAEGMECVYKRHANIGRMTRRGVKDMGLTILPKDDVASNTVTAVNIPDEVDGNLLIKTMREDHGVVLAGGQQLLNGKIFRIGHMGYCTEEEMKDVFNALRSTLDGLGFAF